MHIHDFAVYEKLVIESRSLPKDQRTVTFFDIAGRGHYENPLTDLLSFFLNPNECHGLGCAALTGLCKSLGLDSSWISHDVNLRREDRTEDSKRLDLAIFYPYKAILIEAKVFHSQVNPFLGYEESIRNRTGFSDKFLKKVVLSPNGIVAHGVPDGWQGLSFDALAEGIRSSIVDRPITKWRILCEELISHLFNLGGRSAMNEPSNRFVEKHYAEIKDLEERRKKYLTSLQCEMKSLYQDITKDSLCEVKCVTNWGADWGDVIVLSSAIWGNGAQVGFTPTVGSDNSKSGVVLWASQNLPLEMNKKINEGMAALGARYDHRSQPPRPIWVNYTCRTHAESKALFRDMVAVYHAVVAGIPLH